MQSATLIEALEKVPRDNLPQQYVSVEEFFFPQ